MPNTYPAGPYTLVAPAPLNMRGEETIRPGSVVDLDTDEVAHPTIVQMLDRGDLLPPDQAARVLAARCVPLEPTHEEVAAERLTHQRARSAA